MDITKFDIQTLTGRRPTDEELDYLWVRKRTGAWGSTAISIVEQTWDEALLNTFASGNSEDLVRREVGIGQHDQRVMNSASRMDESGELRYIAKTKNGVINWVCVNEWHANRWNGILLMPDRQDRLGRVCCAQFVGNGNRKVWLTIDEAYQVLQLMQNGETLDAAVRDTKGQTVRYETNRRRNRRRNRANYSESR